jgi:hypothetical protein
VRIVNAYNQQRAFVETDQPSEMSAIPQPRRLRAQGRVIWSVMVTVLSLGLAPAKAQQASLLKLQVPDSSVTEMHEQGDGQGSIGMSSADEFFMGESSGTAIQPSAWPMPMVMTSAGAWNLMWMGQAFLVDTQQTGPHGDDKLYSTNWGMLGATHRLAGGDVMLRAMVSLEPATITGRRYPLLFQTGETAFGEPITNAQHPHNFVMELSAQYAHNIGERSVAALYYGIVGDPALGPVAYPHRASAMEIPQATLGHHWQDSTHIASNVLTGVLAFSKVRFEASGFYGSEPGENRWTIYFGPMNSYSGRITFTPAPRWTAQVSAGHLTNPEAHDPGDEVRTTASVEYVVPRADGNWWATSLIWGRNWKTTPKYGSNAVLAEMLIPIGKKNFLSGRYEWSQRDELFADNLKLDEQLFEQTGARWFDVSSYTVGYTRDLFTIHGAETGLGANVSLYGIPNSIKPFYGDHPLGVNVYLRVRLR